MYEVRSSIRDDLCDFAGSSTFQDSSSILLRRRDAI